MCLTLIPPNKYSARGNEQPYKMQLATLKAMK